MSRTFKSEDERMQAFGALPEMPNPGETVEAFHARIDAEKADIMSAPIVTEQQPAAQPTEPPAAPPKAEAVEPTPQPQTPSPDDDVVFTLSDGSTVRRSDLPEPLRQYKNGREILKSAAHAREYANTAEKQLKQLIAERESWQKPAAQAPEYRPAPAMQSPQAPAAMAQQEPSAFPVVGSVDSKAIEALESEIDSIEDPTMDEATLKKLKKINKSTLGLLKTSYGALSGIRSELTKTQSKKEQEVAELRSKLSKYEEETNRTAKERAEREANQTVEQQITSLVSSYPDLKMSKPHDKVESSLVSFANRYLNLKERRTAQSWADVNRVIGQWNRRDPEMLAFCEANGVRPESDGLTDNDVLNYATIANVLQVTQGRKINEFTGNYEDMYSPFPVNGQRMRVAFPTAKAAYEYLLQSNGIRDKETALRLAQAEQLGEGRVIKAVEQSATASKAIGRDGSSSPDGGRDMSEETALEILGHTPGPRTVDIVKMEQDALAGDRRLWTVYTLAQRRLGFPVEQPPDHWPREVVRQQ